MQSLILGGLIGSIGGLMLAAQTQSAQPGQFATTLTFFAFTIIILGGLGRVKGPIIGTVIFFFVIQFVDNVLNQATRNDKLPDWLVDHEQLRPGQVHRRRARPRRCSWSSGRRASSATAGSRCSMSADLRRRRRAGTVAVEGRPGVAKPDPILVADSVRRAFGGLVAVDVDHVEVQRNEITALIGPNGAGKTTFFNLLTGFDEPDSGQWHVRRPATSPACRRTSSPGSGMVRTFQLTKSLARLSVIENMRLGATGQRGERFWAAPFSWSVARPGAARSPSAPTSCSSASASTTCATSSPATCRAGSASCSRWPGR